MKKRIMTSLILVFPLLLFGCRSPTPQPVDETASQNSAMFTALQRSSGWNYGGYAKDGLYYVSSTIREDGSTNLMYLDYATMQTVYLCSQPNCSHDTETCTSYLPYSAGGILCSVAGDQLVLIFPGNVHSSAPASSTVLPHIEVMGLDGADRKTTVTFEASQQINRPLVTDGTNIYCELDTATEDGNMTAELIRVNLGTGTSETVCPLNQEWVKGGAGSRLILLDANGCYTAFDPITGEREPVRTVIDATVDSLLQDTTLVYKEDGYCHLLDLTSGNTVTLSGFELPSDEEAFVNLVDADATHLIFQIETASHQSGASMEDGYYMVTRDEVPQKWGLLYSSGENVMAAERVTSVSDGQYLVITGEAPPQESSNTQYVATGEKEYSLIPQEDYWNGIAPATTSTQQ